MAYKQHIDGDAGQYVVLGLDGEEQFEAGQASEWNGKLDLVLSTGWLEGTSSLPLGIGERNVVCHCATEGFPEPLFDSFDEAADTSNDLLRMNERYWPPVNAVIGVCYDGYLKALLAIQGGGERDEFLERAAEVNGLEVWLAPERPDGNTNPGGMDEEELAEANRRGAELAENVIARTKDLIKEDKRARAADEETLVERMRREGPPLRDRRDPSVKAGEG